MDETKLLICLNIALTFLSLILIDSTRRK